MWSAVVKVVVVDGRDIAHRMEQLKYREVDSNASAWCCYCALLTYGRSTLAYSSVHRTV